MPNEPELEKTEKQLAAEENIKNLQEAAVKKRKEGEANISLDLGKLMPLVFELLGLEPPKLEDAFINIASLYFGEVAVEEAKEKGPEAVSALIDPLIENIMLLAMTVVSMASAGLVPPPSIPVIKKVFEIIKDFESAASLAVQETQSSGSTSETINID